MQMQLYLRCASGYFRSPGGSGLGEENTNYANLYTTMLHKGVLIFLH